MIEHGGNVDGFSSQLAMLPESNIGFVLLMNTTVSPLQQSSINLIFDTLLGELEEPGVTDETNKYEPYLGKYVNKFGPLANRVYTVIVQNGHLALDANGEQVYELKEPDEEGIWYFAVSDQAAVSFVRDDADKVIVINIHDGKYTFDIPREGTEFATEIDLDELQRYLGSYRSEELKVTAEIKIQNNRLAVDWPGETIYELYPPDQNDIWFFRANREFSLSFQEEADGSIKSLTYYQAGKEYLMPRLDEPGERLPTVAEILALRETDKRNAAIQNMGIYQMVGTNQVQQSGVEGSYNVYLSEYNRARIDNDFGKFGSSHQVSRDGQAWSEAFGRPREELCGRQLDQALRGNPSWHYGDWNRFFDSIQVLQTAEREGRKIYILKLKSSDLPEVTAYVDAENGDVIVTAGVVLSSLNVGVIVVTHYEDYREVDGVRIPFRIISQNEQSGKTVIQLQEVKTNLDVDESIFTPEYSS